MVKQMAKVIPILLLRLLFENQCLPIESFSISVMSFSVEKFFILTVYRVSDVGLLLERNLLRNILQQIICKSLERSENVRMNVQISLKTITTYSTIYNAICNIT